MSWHPLALAGSHLLTWGWEDFLPIQTQGGGGGGVAAVYLRQKSSIEFILPDLLQQVCPVFCEHTPTHPYIGWIWQGQAHIHSVTYVCTYVSSHEYCVTALTVDKW